MQNSDREFIKKYKQTQFQMRHPAPEVVEQEAVAKEAVQEAVQEAVAKEAVQEAVKVSLPPVAAATEVIQKDINEALQFVNELKVDANPLELIKSALQQINYALRLLERETKKDHIIVEKSEPEVHIVVEKSEPEVHIVVEKSEPEVHIVVEKSEPEVHIVVEKSEPEVHIQAHVPVSAELVSIDHISDVDVDEEKEKEFKIVMPKKSKTKKVAVTTVLPVQEKEKKDDFPSLGSICSINFTESSFKPVQKNGFWGGETRKSLEIAKAIAHIPSPTPVSSPSPNLKKSIRMVRRNEVNDDSEDEYCVSTEEFRIRKRGGDYDE